MNLLKIVLPEGDDERVLLAAKKLIVNHECHPILIGDTAKIVEVIGKSADYTAIEPDNSENIIWQGAALVRDGEAEGIVAGVVFATAEVLRACNKLIGMQKGVSRAVGCFLMQKGLKRYLFADSGVNMDPSAEELAEMAYLCDVLASQLGIESKIAFLSFSTKESSSHASVEKVTQAFEITKERYPDILVDGPLQVDAAIIPAVTAIKAPDSPLKGEATVLLFPDLNAGNIAYKLVQRLAGYKAIGCMLLGFAKPACDLSRGCDAADIVATVKVVCTQYTKS